MRMMKSQGSDTNRNKLIKKDKRTGNDSTEWKH